MPKTQRGYSPWLQSDTAIRFVDAGVNESMAAFYDNGAVELYYDGSKKFETYANGCTVTGNLNAGNVDLGDNAKARFGGSNDLEIFHDGTYNTIKSINGELHIKDTDDGYWIRAENNGSVNLYYDGNIKFKTTSTGTYTYGSMIVDGDIDPYSNNNNDLGSSANRWRNIYTNDLNLSNQGSSNDVDGSWGDWTIQEGESDLFLKNNRSGKKYKFNLTEVS